MLFSKFVVSPQQNLTLWERTLWNKLTLLRKSKQINFWKYRFRNKINLILLS